MPPARSTRDMLGGFRGDSVSAQIPYIPAIFKSFEFCIPTKSTTVPDGPDWLHEVKYDGYRLLLERDGERKSGAMTRKPAATSKGFAAARQS
jgi:ATP-dependent DNA ligase